MELLVADVMIWGAQIHKIVEFLFLPASAGAIRRIHVDSMVCNPAEHQARHDTMQEIQRNRRDIMRDGLLGAEQGGCRSSLFFFLPMVSAVGHQARMNFVLTTHSQGAHGNPRTVT